MAESKDIPPTTTTNKDSNAAVIEMQEITEDGTKIMSQTEDESALISAPAKVDEQRAKSNEKKKLWTGNTTTFCYVDGIPLFTIGPHCNACNGLYNRAVLYLLESRADRTEFWMHLFRDLGGDKNWNYSWHNTSRNSIHVLHLGLSSQSWHS